VKIRIQPDSVVRWLMLRKGLIAALFIGVLVPLLIFGALAEDILDDESLRFDNPIQLWARSWQSPALDHWMLTFSAFGSPPLMIGMCVLMSSLLFFLNRRGDALFFLLSIGGAALLNVIAKNFFGRARPDLWVSIDPRADFSFPSGHAMGTMAIFAAIVMIVWDHRFRWPSAFACAMVVVGVGLSRVYLGVHYPSDVFCGWLASFAWVSGLYRIRHARRSTVETDRTLSS
jgi:undecaprenyl-diphosphatase